MVILLGGLESRTVHRMSVRECLTAGPAGRRELSPDQENSVRKGSEGTNSYFLAASWKE